MPERDEEAPEREDKVRQRPVRATPAPALDPAWEAPVIAGPPSEALIRPDRRAAAFFDLDNTMVQGASLFQLAKGLYRRGVFPTRVIVKALWLQAYFRIVGRENPEHIRQARESTLSFIAGRTVAEVQDVGEEVYEESIGPRIWPGTRALAELHLDAGQQVWLVTAAPVEVATTIAERLGLSGALGTTAEHVAGIYTGRLRGELLHGQAKADAVRELAETHGLDLSHCFAYSDSANDVPMLTLVGYPCAVNPDRRLAAYAAAHGWQVRDFRTARRVVRIGLLGVAGFAILGATVAARAGLRRAWRQWINKGLPNAIISDWKKRLRRLK